MITLSDSTDANINIDRALEKQVQDLHRELSGLLQREEERTRRKGRQTGGGIEAGGGVKNMILWFKGNLYARFQLENETREKVRQYFRPKLTDFLRTIDAVLDQAHVSLGDKRLLILIDDTDKRPPTQGLDIFFNHGQHLSVPRTNIVFMVDTSLSCSSKYAAIVGKIGSEEFFPAIKTVERDASSSKTTKANYARLRDLVRQRAGQDFIAPAALDRAIEMSGGVVRELIRILQEAIFRARGHVQTTHVEHAVIRIRNGYNLFSDHIRVLQAVLHAPNWLQTYEGDTAPSETTLLDLLHMPALFQYRNGEDKWYRPYPIFIPWLNKLQS